MKQRSGPESDGGELTATAIDGDQLQVRSFPASMGGNHVKGGYEYIRRLDFASRAERVAGEAVELLSAPPCPAGVTDLVAGVKQGVYVETNRSWSIDDLRLNFQFGMELAREIRNGKLGGLLRNPIYSGVTPQFWASCDGIAGPEAWQVWGITNCGKGEPLQVAHVGHGASPARFRQVQVGVKA